MELLETERVTNEVNISQSLEYTKLDITKVE